MNKIKMTKRTNETGQLIELTVRMDVRIENRQENHQIHYRGSSSPPYPKLPTTGHDVWAVLFLKDNYF